MKKLKKVYQENRVFIILMAIVFICIVVMGIALIKLFFGNGESKYGDRLDGIVNISDSKLSEIESSILSDESITNASVSISGKVVYISIVFNNSLTLEDAKTKAAQSLDGFSEVELENYDFNFTLKQDSGTQTDGFLIMGAKNSNGTTLKWNNNREVTEEDSE